MDRNIVVTTVYQPSCHTIVAVIGFDESIYYVDESAENAMVTVRLLSGRLSSDVLVRLTTEDNTAQGGCHPILALCLNID